MSAALRMICGGGDDDPASGPPFWTDGPAAADPDDLPYRVEVWDESGEFPERVVAVALTPALAYAAYFAAAREYVGRNITVTHNGVTLSTWRIRPN